MTPVEFAAIAFGAGITMALADELGVWPAVLIGMPLAGVLGWYSAKLEGYWKLPYEHLRISQQRLEAYKAFSPDLYKTLTTYRRKYN